MGAELLMEEFRMAMVRDDVDTVRRLIDFVDPDNSRTEVVPGPYGPLDLTMINLACSFDSPGVVRFLLEHGADPNSKDNDGDTPLHCACGNNYADVAEVLLSGGARINDRGGDGVPPLVVAGVMGHLEAARVLLRYGANVGDGGEYGYTALGQVCRAAASRGRAPDTRIVDLLLRNGANYGDACDARTYLAYWRENAFGARDMVVISREDWSNLYLDEFNLFAVVL